MGVIWALFSVILVSIAQLLLRRAMSGLPPLSQYSVFISNLLHLQSGTGWLLCGVVSYLLSMVCWFVALRHLPLAKACSLLSLSYIIVWAAAIWLPGWKEPFHWQSLAGVLVTITGVLTIFWTGRRPD